MNNLAILLNSEFLDLNDTSIRMERVNPFFINELFQGDYSFPFEIPATEKNLRLTNYSTFISSGERILSYLVDLYIFGIPKARLRMVITRGKSRSISIVLVGGIKSLRSADMKLADLPLGEDVILGADTASIVAKATAISKIKDWRTYGFSFVPFYMPEFYGDKNPDFVGVVNQMNSSNGDILCNNSPVNGNPHTIVPWLFLFYLLNRIFLYEGLEPSGPWWENEENATLLLSNNYSLDGGYTEGSVRVETVPGLDNDFEFTNDRVLFQLGPANTYDTSGSWNNAGAPGSFYVVSQLGTHYVDVELLVQSFMSVVVGFTGTFVIEYDFVEVARCSFDLTINTAVQKNQMSFTFTVGLADLGKTITCLFYWEYPGVPANQVACQVMPGSSMTIKIDRETNSLSDTLKYKNHVADQTVGEFLADIKTAGVNFDFDFMAGKIVLSAVDDLINFSERVNMSEKATPDYDLNLESAGKGITIFYKFPEDEKVNLKLDDSKFKGEFNPRTYFPQPTNEGEWIILSGTNEVLTVGKNPAFGTNEWQSLGYNYGPLVLGAGESEITCNLAPVQMVIANNSGGTVDENTALMPRLYGQGYSSIFGNGTNPQPFRLAFWRGQNRPLSFLPQGGNYILATSGIYGINGDTYGKVSLRLDQPNGMIVKNSQKFYNAVTRGEELEKDLSLDALDVFNLKNFMMIDVDFNTFIMKSISTVIWNHKTEGKVYLLKL